MRRTGCRSLSEEFDTDREEQQGDADLRQQFDVVDSLDGRALRERSDSDAGENVAEQERLAETVRQQAADEGGDEDDGNVSGDAHRDLVSRMAGIAGGLE